MCPNIRMRENLETMMKSGKLEHTKFDTAAAVQDEFPMFKLSEPMTAILEHDAGTLHPDTATRAYQVLPQFY